MPSGLNPKPDPRGWIFCNIQGDDVLPFLNNKSKQNLTTLTSLLVTLYIIYVTFYGPMTAMMVHRALFLAIMLVMYFSILNPLGDSPLAKTVDTIFIVLTLLSLGYVIVNYGDLLRAAGGYYLTNLEIGLGFVLILVVLEATRRSSTPFFIVVLCSVIYTMFGQNLPGILQHPGIPIYRLVYLVSFTSEGIFGVGVAVAAGILFIFILFGSTMEVTGIGNFFIKFANSLVGGTRGGSAKAALVGSSLLGSVMGNSTANAVVTGTFTIPLMIKGGFKRRVAAAIECLASEGGQYLPPIMGASAFIMAQITTVPYPEIAVAGIIPALLYYGYAFLLTDLESIKSGLKGIPKGERILFRDILKNEGYKLIPLLVAFYTIIVLKMTPMYAGLLATLIALVITQMKNPWRNKIENTIKSFDQGTRNLGKLIGLLSGIGLVQQAFVITGLGARLSSILISFAGGSVILLLLIGMVCAIILGMGMPTPIAYLLVALFIAPALIDVGIPVIAAHLFLLYIAVKSGSTPPVAVVAMVTAAIAEADFWKTSLTAFAYSIPTFILAFAFVYHPELLLLQGTLLVTAFYVIITMISLGGASCAIIGVMFGKLHIGERALTLIGSIMLLSFDKLFLISGILILVSIGIKNWISLARTDN